MTISYNWLKTYLNIDLPAERVGEILTDTGLEVEGIEKIETLKGGLKGVVVGEVLTCEQHPNADRLKITTVNVGAEEPLHIVCGAPNVAVGHKVPVATIGTVLYANGEPFTIKKGKIRGEVSEGMICAEDELGLGESHDGIMILKADTPIGTPAHEYFNIEDDYVFEIGLTPNRTDAMSHYGVARDLRAGLIQQGITAELTLPKVDFNVDNTNLTIPVVVENKEACPQYLGVTISGVTVEPSPDWLQNRLRAIGLKPINNVVDVTNFVLHETGHPLHAFDAAAITGNKVLVKNLPQGTPFTLLDGTERKLDANDLMICNAEGGMCLAGVFGGISSGVTEKTKNVFLEGAYFNAVHIRKAAKRHALNTDASYRYERGVDPNMTRYALQRAALLIKEVAGGSISSEIQEAISATFEPVQIELKHSYLNSLIGNDIPAEKVEEILTSLEFEILKNEHETWTLAVPTYRVDVTRPADVVEEFLRIYGFNNVELPQHMKFSLASHPKDASRSMKAKASAFLTAIGYYETMNNSLTKLSYYEKFMKDENGRLVQILNPLSQDLGVMRQSLVFGGMEVVERNVNRQQNSIKIFEFGATYFKNGSGHYEENDQLLLGLSGIQSQESWQGKAKPADFFHLKGVLMGLFDNLGLTNLTQKTAQHALLGNCLTLYAGTKIVAELGSVAQPIRKHFDVDQEVFMAIINWQVVVKVASKRKYLFEELPRFPKVRRDLALLLDEEMQYENLRQAALKAGGKLLKEVNLFDEYTGKNLPEGKKSYAMSFILQDPEQTLTDKRVEDTMAKILSSFEKQFGAVLR
jgi:phenylalanyl-tRNA synthetase beta chain